METFHSLENFISLWINTQFIKEKKELVWIIDEKTELNCFGFALHLFDARCENQTQTFEIEIEFTPFIKYVFDIFRLFAATSTHRFEMWKGIMCGESIEIIYTQLVNVWWRWSPMTTKMHGL